ncbi:MAG: glycogen debranching enzyme family protein [Paludibacteraceae bacterium]|nr:glycogen debranching enzyme family protein [Paludibacteraceae bacterium]MBQ9100639.1 glycogen debranching enzyme family protein [Paludibacteraceae bacterium]
MSYLKFDKSMLTNLEQSLTREMLRTNKSGAYHCTTIIGCNTRKYHGLLVMPVKNLDNDNHVLLSSFDETVVQHGTEFNLGIHKYQGDNYYPKGHKYLREFNCDIVPRGIYRVGGVILSKEKVFISYENRILIKYTLVDAHSPTVLRFRPFLAFRNVNSLCVENYQADTSYQGVSNGISVCMYQGYPNLYMQFNKEVNFVSTPYWNKGIEYAKELERGYYYKEDLFVPGYFEVPIKKGESIIFSAGVSEVDTANLSQIYYEEISKRTARNSFFNCLKNSAQQCFNRKNPEELYLLAGYPWFKCLARDLFISLPGVSLAFDDLTGFEKIMATLTPALRNYMEGKPIGRDVYGLEDPDVLLWMIWAVQEYAKETGNTHAWEMYGELLKDAIEFILKQRHNNLFVHENGLVYLNGWDKAVTWMNSTFEGRPITPRSGYVVEVNALWYNALRFVADLALEFGEEHFSESLTEYADKVKENFAEVFWNGYYLYDFVSGDYKELSVRPNMIFAASLKYSPLENKQKKAIVDIATKELLTPKGLRSLSPKSPNYHGTCDGSQQDRDFAAFQGAAWPWLIGPYLEAYLSVYKNSGYSFAERTLIGFEEEMHLNCIGTLSEMYDANPPFKGRGGISFTKNVAEVLRVLKVLKNFYKD